MFGYLYRRYYLYPRISKYLNGSVLDVGCGIGDYLDYSKNAVGLDINPFNVEYCVKKGFSALLIERDTFPVESNRFDGAILDNVLEHLDEPDIILRETYRVLHKSGVLVIGVPGRKGYLSDPDHSHFYTEKSLISTLYKYGFKDCKLLHLPFRSSWLDRNLNQYCIYGVFERI